MTTIETRWSRQRSLRAFAIGAAIGIAACSGPMAGKDSLPELEDGSIRGELIDMIARYDDDTTFTTYFLRVNGNERDQRELVLERAPFLPPMAKVKVWGVEREGRIIVDRLEPVDPADNIDITSTSQQPLINPVPIAPTKLAMAVIDVGAGSNITTDELQKRLFTNPNSTRQYYLENSYGAHDLVGMVSPKTYSYPMTTCDTSALATAIRPMIDTDVGQVSDIYLWYFGSKVSACAWSGLSSGKDTYYNASSSCVVLVQEPGHSFGMSHSSSMVCTDPASGAVVPFRDDLGSGDVQNCTHNEYGNRYDTMGGGCRHFNAYNKVYRRYFQQCNGVNVRKSGTFNLMPLEKPCNGIQALQIPMPRVRGFFRTGGGGSDGVTQLAYYTVELRAPIGLYDNTMKPTVIINATPKYTIMSTAGGRGGRGEHSWLLDMAASVTGTGTDGTQHALVAGQTFTDPGGGVAITTMSVGPEGAVIKVDITGATTVPDAGTETVCLDGTPISEPGPPNCGDDGGGPPPPIDVVTPPPPTPDTGTTADVRTDATGAGGMAGTGGATTGTGGAGGAGTGGATTGTGGATTGTGGATTGTGGATTGAGGATTGAGGATTGAGGTTSGTGGDTTGGAGTRPTTPETPSGCGCRIPAASDGDAHPGRYALFGLALAGLARRRARRRAA